MLSEGGFPKPLTFLGGASSWGSPEWLLFLPRGMYSKASGTLLGSRITPDSSIWETETMEGIRENVWEVENRGGGLTSTRLWSCRSLSTLDEGPGIFFWCKLLESSWWKLIHLTPTFIPKKPEHMNPNRWDGSGGGLDGTVSQQHKQPPPRYRLEQIKAWGMRHTHLNGAVNPQKETITQSSMDSVRRL